MFEIDSKLIIGYIVFCMVKFVGYSFAGLLLSESYRRSDRNSWAVGGTRTLIGMGASAAYYGLFNLLSIPEGALPWIGLIPVRLAEWWLLLWMFYDRPLQQRPKGWRCVSFGTFWSYLLDLPAIVATFESTPAAEPCAPPNGGPADPFPIRAP